MQRLMCHILFFMKVFILYECNTFFRLYTLWKYMDLKDRVDWEKWGLALLKFLAEHHRMTTEHFSKISQDLLDAKGLQNWQTFGITAIQVEHSLKTCQKHGESDNIYIYICQMILKQYMPIKRIIAMALKNALENPLCLLNGQAKKEKNPLLWQFNRMSCKGGCTF